ncbi:MAG: hypothetical protein AAGF79_09690 [Pseudomonadota bacterium]
MRVGLICVVLVPLAVGGCGSVGGLFDRDRSASAAEAVPTEGADVVEAVVVDDSVEEGVAEVPVALPVSGDTVLGTTVAALGDPAVPGLWMETPLTRREQTGQVRYQASSVTVTLRPTGGDAGSGSRLSLLAMQALGAPLTDLVEVTVTGAQ